VRTGLLLLDAGEIERLVPPADAIRALEDALAGGQAPGEHPPRSAVPAGGGELLLMPAGDREAVGVKLVTVAPDRPDRALPRIQGLYAYFDAGTLAPVALLDGVALTSLRTPATSAVATDRLAVADARTLVVFGAGPQAWGHVLTMRAVRPIQRLLVVARDRRNAERLAARASGLGLDAAAAAADAVASADVVCTCTTSAEPVFDGRLLAAHAHVNAVGSHRPEVRELDDAAVRGAAIVVETRRAALAEAGDLLLPLRAGVIGEDAIVADLAELVRGTVRVDPGRRTVFKSVGMAFEDLAVAKLAVARAVRERGGR
jgi:ornithine cyclodeaminase/alanine dehydrogenase-like protein (mu-crystallin family)